MGQDYRPFDELDIFFRYTGKQASFDSHYYFQEQKAATTRLYT